MGRTEERETMQAAAAEAAAAEANGEPKDGASPTIREGYRYALAGKIVRRKNVDGTYTPTGSVFATKDIKGREVKLDNAEAPAPVTEAAAAAAAADLTTSLYFLQPDGSVKEEKVTGVIAAVNIALQARPHETWRGKLRACKATVAQVKAGLLAQYGFGTGKVEAKVERDALAAIMADASLSAEERTAKVVALMAAGGVQVG